jgi:chemosensory pili system protein ChpA (sensor histidine kinase/response regulator)
MSELNDQGILLSFIGEVRAQLPALERQTARLAEPGAGAAALAEIRRLAHTIRGASDMVGLARVSSAARALETLVSTAPDDAGIGPATVERARQDVALIRAELDVLGAGGPIQSDAEPPAPADLIDEEIFRAFSIEAEQLFDTIREQIARLRGSSGAPAMAPLRNAVHTLKGAAGMAGLSAVSRLAHRIEDVLGLIDDGRLPAEPEILDILVAAHDLLGDLVAARGSTALVQEAYESLNAQFDLLDSLAAETRDDAPAPAAESEFAEHEETDETLIETFLAEAETHMLSAGDAFRALASEPSGPPELLAVLRRSAHTIKGAAGMVGLMAASRLAKGMQTLLDRIAERTVSYSPAIYDTLGDSFDLLADLIEARGSNSALLGRLSPLIERLDAAGHAGAGESAQPASMAAAAPEPPRAEAAPPQDSLQPAVRVPMDRLAGVSRLVGEVFLNASSFEQQAGAFKRELDELALNLSRMRRLSAALAEEQANEEQLRGAKSAAGPASAAEFDVLEFDRYSRLNLLSRDLAEATNDLSTLSGQLNSMRAQFDAWAGRQRGLSGEAQDQLMRMRLVPLSTLANRLHRTVRVSASKTGKQASLTLAGMETEFDKAVADQLSGPLEHLLRNAVDHGIESPEARLAAGKSLSGQIRLEASHQGAHLVIRLSDDGAGLDYERIRRRAAELGWMTAEQSATLDNGDLERLILEPGFSTASTVSEISGRGVGLDAVASSVQALRGRFSVQSTPGQGAVFTLRLPVSMAVAKTMIVEAGLGRFAVPMVNFTRALRVGHEELEVRDGQAGIQLADGWVPVMDLAAWLGVQSSASASQVSTLLFVDNGEREIALAVDKVLEAREVVVKPLSRLLRRQQNFAGAAILGDGSVVLIINAATLDPAAAARYSVPLVRTQQPVRSHKVIVVDDSISVRRSVASLMKSAGWEVLTARDGVDALEQLQEPANRPDLVLMDIEMPRMDGYELASRLRASADLQSVPIIMLTSRAGEKHRRKAAAIGVDGYLVKPCPDDVLLDEVARCLASGKRLAS